MFVYEEGERIIIIIIEPVPSPDELYGIKTGEQERGEVLERVGELKDEEKRQEEVEVKRLRPSEDA